MENNIMKMVQDFADKAADGAMNAMHSASKAVSETYDSVMVNVERSRIENQQEEIFADMGRMLFLMQTGVVKDIVGTDDGDKTPQQVIDALLVEADQCQQQIDLLKDKMSEGKDELVCSNCGRVCDEHDAFCAVCGAKLSEVENG